MPVPLYETAAGLLEELAKPLFQRSMRAPDGSRAAHEAFECWHVLRAIAGRMRCTKSINLNERNRDDMDVALSLVHDMAHNLDPAGPKPTKDCSCIEACCIESLKKVLEAYEKQFGRGGSYAA
jgi:hypothetical protein